MIYVDTREKEDLEKYLKKHGIPVERTTLNVGDYAFSNVGVEFKRYNDLYNSIISGRIWKQLYGLKEYPRPVLLLLREPPSPSIKDYKRFHTMIRSCKAIVALRFKIPVLEGSSIEEVGDLIIQLYLKSAPSASSRPLPVKRPYTSIMEVKENLLGSIPLVGLKKARVLLNKYHSIRNIAEQSVEELASNKGIGRKIAETILEVLN